MAFIFGVFFKGIGYSDRAVIEVLFIYGFNCCIRSIKRSKINKGIIFGVVCVRVSYNFGGL